jgi:excinuclease UvrABC helicase subunit UvrB
MDEITTVVREIRRGAEKKMKYSDAELKQKIRKDMEKKMLEYAQNLEFEKAAALRDLIAEL